MTIWKNQLFCAALLGVVLTAVSGASLLAAERYAPPESPRQRFNFNVGWKFIKQDVAGAEAASFDDSKWDTVCTPHTYNDVDTFDEIITKGGEKSLYMGVAWYRKHFRLPAEAAGSKVFIEFEGMKQAGRFFVNGKAVGIYENGVTACGIDITDAVQFGPDKGNVLAVKIDNSRDYKEESSGVSFQWMSKDFNPNYGGINKNVWLHITGKVYQTLPLFENLKTTGVYIYAKNIDVPTRTVDVAVESQVKNESGDQKSVDLSVVIVDREGNAVATFKGETYDMVGGESGTLKAEGKLASAKLWDANDPALYDVFTILSVDGKAVDVVRTATGFRKTEFRGGAGAGGVYINDRFVYLTGYAQRSTNEWAGLGQAYPDWLHDYTAKLIRGSNANYIRWMHITPARVDVTACDKAGIVQICPAGDKEKDAEGRQWEQRLEVMRDSIIYLRNHPSILFWEAGNNGVTAEHMKQMKDLREQWDPHGGRAMGCRTLNDPASTPHAEYFGVMIGQDARTDQLKTPTDMFRAYSAERRDKAPLIETEDFRDEAARRFWDDYSPPHFGFKKQPDDTWNYNSETFCLAAARRYNDYLTQIITDKDPAKSKWSGYASIIFADTNSHGRQYGSEVCRVSGKVDAVRLPKQAYFAYRVMQSAKPDIHIIGHWSYPKDTTKTMYVFASHVDSVELLINGVSKGKVASAQDGFVFAFPNLKFEPGKIKAVGTLGGKVVCEQELQTAGEPKKIKLTPIVGPAGLTADGADVALIDVEVLDADGVRCPTDEARIDFAVEGPCVWRGGYNSGKPGSTNNLYLDTECGVNRVAVRSTLQGGTIRITAKRQGLESATVEIPATPISVKDGLIAAN